jgi:radical SAM PhpK family P-methyltransferase
MKLKNSIFSYERNDAMTDCLIIGFNDSDFASYVEMVKSMGTDSGAYRDLDLAFIEYQGRPQRSMDVLNHFYSQTKGGAHKPFHNADFLWPVVTYLGSYLHQRGLSFDYVNLFHLEKEKLKEKLLKNDILTIAITTTLYVSPHPILEIVSFIRQYNDTAKILVGGPYISNQPKMGDQEAVQYLFKHLGADIYVISSEGEGALVNIIRALKTGASLDRIDNIAYREGEHYVLTTTSIESNPLEENPVNYGLFPPEEVGEFVTLRTAKSCPFSCSFCGFPQRAGKYKYTGVDLVEKELNAIRDIGGVTTLTFIDDTFNVPKERFKEICRMMIRNNYGFKWNSFYRSDHGDEETIELMAKSGCEGVFLGIESGSDEMLQRMNKTARRKDYLKSIPLLKAAGISTHANVIVGFPGETFETVQETIDLFEEVKPDFFRAQLWYADPVTPIWNKRDEYGVKGSSFNWSHDTMDYQMACDLVDKMFISVQGSIWLPQNGFEQWSTFYLQRKGMTMEQIKTFLKCFNAVIKEKLIYPNKKEIDPQLLESLKASCQFDQTAEPDLAPVEVFSGAGYTAAEQFWLKEFGGVSTSNIEMMRESVQGQGDANAPVIAIEESLLERVRLSCDAETAEILLAAYSVLLSRLSGQAETVMIAAFNEDGLRRAIPLKLEPSWTEGFASFVKRMQQKVGQAMGHRLSAFHILTNPYRMAQHSATCPAFDVGYASRDLRSRPAESALEGLMDDYPALRGKLGLVLHVERDDGGISIRFDSPQNWFSPETMEKLNSYLASILREVGENPEALIGEIKLDGEYRPLSETVEQLESEVFNF